MAGRHPTHSYDSGMNIFEQDIYQKLKEQYKHELGDENDQPIKTSY